jgi:hypothetical protein
MAVSLFQRVNVRYAIENQLRWNGTRQLGSKSLKRVVSRVETFEGGSYIVGSSKFAHVDIASKSALLSTHNLHFLFISRYEAGCDGRSVCHIRRVQSVDRGADGRSLIPVHWSSFWLGRWKWAQKITKSSQHR